MFETKGTIDEAMLKEIQKHVIRPGQIIIFSFMLLIFCFCAVIGILSDELPLLLLGICGIILVIVEIIVLQRRSIKTMLARTTESVGQPYMIYESSFTPEGVQIHNHSNHAHTLLKYEVFRRMTQTPHFYLLLTKTWQFVPVFKDCLAPGAEKELIAFLKQQPTQIKWKK